MTDTDVVRVCSMFETVYSEGQPAEAVYVIEEGSFTSQSADKNSRHHLDPFEKGQVLGMFDTILERPYSRTVECISGGKVRIISKEAMNSEIDSSDTFLKAILKSTIKRLEAKHKKGFT